MWRRNRKRFGDGIIMDTIKEIKKIENRMKIEKLVFESLKHEELTEEFIDNFIKTMQKMYQDNINALNEIVGELQKDGK